MTTDDPADRFNTCGLARAIDTAPGQTAPIPITHIHLSILSQPTNTVSTTEHSGSSETASSPVPLAIFAIH
jgi:hypothetical protein